MSILYLLKNTVPYLKGKVLTTIKVYLAEKVLNDLFMFLNLENCAKREQIKKYSLKLIGFDNKGIKYHPNALPN